MSNLLSFNKAVFSSILETFTGGEDAQKTFLKRQKLKAETYQALLTYWNAVTKELNENNNESRLDKSVFVQATDDFYTEISDVFGGFDEGVRYDKMGVLEKGTERFGEFFHKNIFTGSDSYKKEIENEFQKFWDNFFQLKGEPLEVESKEEKQLSYVSGSIVELGANTTKTVIESFNPVTGRPEDASQVPKDKIEIKLLESLKREEILVSVADAKEKAEAITKNIESTWRNYVADLMINKLTGGDLISLNHTYRDGLDNTLLSGFALSVVINTGTCSILFSILKDNNLQNDLTSRYEDFFDARMRESLVPLGKSDTKDLKNDFYDFVIESAKKEGIVSVFSKPVLDMGAEVIDTVSSEQSLMNMIGLILTVAMQNYPDMTGFMEEVLDNYEEIERDLKLVIKESNGKESELIRYWLNIPPWSNETNVDWPLQTFKRRTEGSKFFVDQMIVHIDEKIDTFVEVQGNDEFIELIKEWKVFMNTRVAPVKTKISLESIYRQIADESLPSIVYANIVDRKDQINWYLENTIGIQLELRKKDLLGDVLEAISLETSEAIARSLKYALIIMSRNWKVEQMKSDSSENSKNGNENLGPSFNELINYLRLAPNQYSKNGALIEDESVLYQKEAGSMVVNSLLSAMNWIDLNIPLSNDEQNELDSFESSMQKSMQEELTKLLKVQLEHYYPNCLSSSYFDPNVNYDLSTFRGVVADFLRSVNTIVERDEAINS